MCHMLGKVTWEEASCKFVRIRLFLPAIFHGLDAMGLTNDCKVPKVGVDRGMWGSLMNAGVTLFFVSPRVQRAMQSFTPAPQRLSTACVIKRTCSKVSFSEVRSGEVKQFHTESGKMLLTEMGIQAWRLPVPFYNHTTCCFAVCSLGHTMSSEKEVWLRA